MLTVLLHRDSTKTFGSSYSYDTYVDATLTTFRLDYGFSSTRPVKGESLSTGAFARWYLDLFIDAAMHVSIYSVNVLTYIYSFTQDKDLASIMWHVRMLLSPPTDMASPSAIWKVGRNYVSRSLSQRLF